MTKSPPLRSLKRSSCAPYLSQRPDSCHSSAGMTAGRNTSRRAGAVHLLADDARDLLHHAPAERQERVDPGRHLAQVAAAHHEDVGRDLRLGGRFLQRGDQGLRQAHRGHGHNTTRPTGHRRAGATDRTQAERASLGPPVARTAGARTHPRTAQLLQLMQTRAMRGRLVSVVLLSVPLASCVTVRPPAARAHRRGPGRRPARAQLAPPEGARADEAAALDAAVAGIDLARPEAGPRPRSRGSSRVIPARPSGRSPRRTWPVLPWPPAIPGARAPCSIPAASDGGRRAWSASCRVSSRRARASPRGRWVCWRRSPRTARRVRIPDRDDAELSLQAALAEARLAAGDPGGRPGRVGGLRRPARPPGREGLRPRARRRAGRAPE